MNWYIVQSYSGFEKKVVESIKDNLKKNKLDQHLDQILVPTHQVTENASKQKSGFNFEIGEKVKVCDGPFASFSGLIEEIDEEKSRLKVSVSIFGRPTPVDLEFNQVEKN